MQYLHRGNLTSADRKLLQKLAHEAIEAIPVEDEDSFYAFDLRFRGLVLERGGAALYERWLEGSAPEVIQ
ncbi:MAG: hypothetical protein NVSMB64_26380 [Candidatus Velthaea sp.]